MNAKRHNASIRKLFFGGDPLAAMLADGMRQLDEAVTEERQRREALRTTLRTTYAECPCGCGLQGDVCEAQLLRIQILDEELPF